MAASALVSFELSGSQPVSCATGATEDTSAGPASSPKGVQLLSISPGCTMASPTLAWSLLASTWLLPSKYSRLLASSTSAPNVPLQQSTIWLPRMS